MAYANAFHCLIAIITPTQLILEGLQKVNKKALKTRRKGYKNGRVKDLVWGINITGIIKLYILTEYIVNLMYPYTGLRHG